MISGEEILEQCTYDQTILIGVGGFAFLTRMIPYVGSPGSGKKNEMGQTLSEPITTKHTTSGEDERLAFGASCMQGWRISMEDAHTHLLTLDPADQLKNSFFAVFDGHGGANVAKYAGLFLHQKLLENGLYKEGKYNEAFKKTFLKMDSDMLSDPIYSKEMAGCTAVAALITHDWKLIVANAGDSRAVLCSKGEAVPLSFDHKPTNAEETNRIVNAGGYVDFGRVNALSRAFGDFEFKKNTSLSAEEQAVTADPDITERSIIDADEFVIIACDGIWDCMTNQTAVHFVSQKISDGLDLPEVCEAMMDACLASTSEMVSLGCDNMTVIIVAILKGKTKAEWLSGIKSRYDALDMKLNFSINNGEGVN